MTTDAEQEHERREREQIDRLKPQLTPEFFATLLEAAKVYGWSGDYTEVADFVIEVNRWAGFDVPPVALDPYE